MGLRQTMITKNIGANMFKNMVEGDKVIIKDVDLIQELYFTEKGKSWEWLAWKHRRSRNVLPIVWLKSTTIL